MGILTRFKWLLKPRSNGSGRLWDNVNTPGSVGWSAAPTRGLAWPYSNNFVPGPNPEPYLHEGISATDPRRLHASPRNLQPRIAVQEPRGTGQPTYINNTMPSTNTPQALPSAMPIQAIAPSQTRQRDLEWDAGDSRTLQRFVFAKTPSQVYFDEKTPLPEFTTPATYANAVIAGANGYFPSSSQTGWEQSFVPEPGMRMNEVGTAPPTLLSRPLNVRTLQVQTSARQPLKARSPKRKRTGG
jgi:hypothetical protein